LIQPFFLAVFAHLFGISCCAPLLEDCEHVVVINVELFFAFAELRIIKYWFSPDMREREYHQCDTLNNQ
jgi:hypothetical protein